MSLEQKYLKYKNKYLELKNKNSNNQAFNNMRGGAIYKQLTYERVDIDLPETFDIGELIVFVGKLTYKSKSVGTTVIKYFITDTLDKMTGGFKNETNNGKASSIASHVSEPVSRSLESALDSSAQPPLPQSRVENLGTTEFSSSSAPVRSLPPESPLGNINLNSSSPAPVRNLPSESPIVVSNSPTHIVKIALTMILFDGTMYSFSNENVPISLKAAANRTLAPYEVTAILDLKRNNNFEKDLKLEFSIKDGKGKFTINPSGSIF